MPLFHIKINIIKLGEVKMVLSDKLRYLMMNAVISQQQLAEETKIERSTLTKILNGSTLKPKTDTIYTLAKYFNVNIEELLNEEKPLSKISTKDEKTIQEILQMLMKKNQISTISLLHKYIGVPISVLSDILNGKTTNPNIKTLQAIATFFNITIPQLCGVDSITSTKKTQTCASMVTIPILLLSQINQWKNGEEIENKNYIKSTGEFKDNVYAVSLNNNLFKPDFLNGSLLIIDSEKLNEHNFIICKVNNVISIYEIIAITNLLITLREAGTYKSITTNNSEIEILGTVVQEILNKNHKI